MPIPDAGTVTLSGRAEHSGTVIDVSVLLSLSGTDSAGHFEIDDIPSGVWTVEASHLGFATGTAPATIPAPGDSVAIAPLQLVPGIPSARIGRIAGR